MQAEITPTKLLVGFFMVFLLVVGSVSALTIQEVRQATSFEKLTHELNPFSIVTDKGIYTRGETAVIQDFQDINAYCSMLSAEVTIKNPAGQIVDSGSRGLGAAGYMTAFIRITEDTSKLPAGTYTVEGSWNCDGTELGQDGYRDSNTQPSVSTFQVQDGTAPAQQICATQCDVGYKLVNPDSPSCYCQPTFKDNDGKCDLGEPATNNDCKNPKQCPSGQVLSSGLCVVLNPSGGNSNGGSGSSGLSVMQYLIIGMVFLIVGGLLFYIWRKKRR